MKIADAIRYEGDNNTFIWKYPGEDFNTLSQLIVHESQEALLFLNGQALDLFGSGRHTLHTSSIPLINRILKIPTGGESSFHCEVYFINKTEQMGIKWGVGDVNFCDPTHNDYAFKIGASGEMSLRVNDSRKIIVKLVGTEAILDRESVEKDFKALITTKIKTFLPKILREKRVSIFDVESCLSELSEILKAKISDAMADYGIVLEKFWVNTVKKPEDDPIYIKFNRQRAEKVMVDNQGELDMQRADYQRRTEIIKHTGEDQKRRIDIDTKRYKQEQLGYTYQQERGFDVMEKIAENEGSGSDLRNAAMAIGMGAGVGGAFGNVIANISNNTMSDLMQPVTPPPAQDDSFGGTPGMIDLKEEASTQAKSNDDEMSLFRKNVEKLSIMKESGFLSEAEFNAEKKLLLDEIKGGK